MTPKASIAKRETSWKAQLKERNDSVIVGRKLTAACSYSAVPMKSTRPLRTCSRPVKMAAADRQHCGLGALR